MRTDNACYPKKVIDDPGFALLKSDKYYESSDKAKNDKKKYVPLYEMDNPPSPYKKQLVDQLQQINKERKQKGLVEVSIEGLDSDSGSSSPPHKKHKSNHPPDGDSRKRDAGPRALQVLEDGFAISSRNSTRRLTLEEVRREVEVLTCADETCSKERAELGFNDLVAIIHPAPRYRPRARRTPAAVEAVATAVYAFYAIELLCLSVERLKLFELLMR